MSIKAHDIPSPNYFHAVHFTGTTDYSSSGSVPAYFQVDDEGYLKCVLKSSVEISGDLAVDVWSFQNTTGVDANAYVFVHDEDLTGLSGTNEMWQGVGGFDETADRFRAIPIATDNAAMPANAQFIPMGGEYNATLPTYADGDSALFQLDNRGRIITAVELNDYVDDSTEFETGTSKMLAVGGIATGGTGTVGSGSVGAFAMSVNREQLIKGKIWDGTNEAVVLNAGTESVSNAHDQLIVAGMNYGFNGTSWDRQIMADSLSGGTTADSLKHLTGTETGLQPVLILGHDPTSGAEAYRAIKLGTDGELAADIDGVYDASANADPDNVGLIVHTSGTTPVDSWQSVRVTGGTTPSSIHENQFHAVDTRSLLLGYDSELNTLRSAQVAVDNAGLGSTPNVLVTGGIYKDSPDTYNDNDASPLHLDSKGNLLVSDALGAPATLLSGTLGMTTTAGTFAASTTCKKVTLQADYGNSDYLFVGNATLQTIRLNAGESLDIEINDLEKVYVKANSGTQTIAWLGS